MITFLQGNTRFTHRAVGIALHEGYALLHRADGDDFWALPGGRVELRETSAETLRREMGEEIGAEVTVGRLVWVVENFFRYREVDFHELGLYYLFDFPAGSPLYRVGESFYGQEDSGTRLIFRWFPLDGLPCVRLYPTFLRGGLASLPPHTVHIVHTDLPDEEGHPYEDSGM